METSKRETASSLSSAQDCKIAATKCHKLLVLALIADLDLVHLEAAVTHLRGLHLHATIALAGSGRHLAHRLGSQDLKGATNNSRSSQEMMALTKDETKN